MLGDGEDDEDDDDDDDDNGNYAPRRSMEKINLERL